MQSRFFRNLTRHFCARLLLQLLCRALVVQSAPSALLTLNLAGTCVMGLASCNLAGMRNIIESTAKVSGLSVSRCRQFSVRAGEHSVWRRCYL